MMGAELLEDAEVALCQTLRVQPMVYLNHKAYIIERSTKYTKKQIIKAVCMDVNKTRRVYDW